MRRRSGPVGAMSGAVARRLAVGLLGISFAVALPAVAQANNLFSIDPQAESTGPIVTDSSGTGYVAWNREGSEVEQPMFCKIPRGDSCTDPIALSLPVQSPQSADGVIQPFPVLGGAVGVVYVVGPRYNRDDTLIWTSTNGGESFTVKEIPTGSFPDKTGVGDVLFNPNFDAAFPAATDETFAIAGENPGIGYGNTSNITTESTPTSFTFADPGADVSGATLGFTTKTKVRLGHAAFPAVEAYWTDTTPYQVDFYRYPAKPAPETEAGGWEGPFTATDGYEPHLAGGPSGLFLLSTDLASGEPAGEQPSVIDVRKYNEATEAFEAPTTIANIPTDSGTLFTSGDIFQNPVTGALYVVQPVSENGEYVMRLWESTDGGQTFHGERDIATIGYGYEGVPRLAVAEDGHGWLTFKDYGGLEVADLNPLAFATTPIIGAPVPSPTPLPAPTPLPTTTTTTQSGAGSAGASITVPQGTAVSDQAHIAGAAVASATGTVTYNLYKDSKCTVAATAGSTASVLGGVAGPSAAVKPGPGTYYWKVSYGGNATNDGSTSACGSEVLVVAVNEKHLGLPPSNACLSKRAFLVHPRAPKGVKLVSVEVLINGKLKKKGALSGHATTVNLAGLPKGTFKVALITKSSKGKTYEELRTFHTCVAGKHKKK